MVTQLLNRFKLRSFNTYAFSITKYKSDLSRETRSFFHYRKKKKSLLQELFLPILSEVPQHGDFSSEEVEGSLKSHKPLGSKQALLRRVG